MAKVWVKGKGGVEGEEGVGWDGGEGKDCRSDDRCKSFVKGKGEEKKTKKILKKRNEMCVDEVDAGRDWKMLSNNLLRNCFRLPELGGPVVLKSPFEENRDTKIGGFGGLWDQIPGFWEREGRRGERE